MSLLGTFFRRLFSSGGSRMLAKGSLAPAFDLPDQDGRRVKLADFAGRRVVVWFYPKADTPGCTKQTCAFRDWKKEYEKKGIALLGVSFDEPAANKAFAAKFGFTFPLLSDTRREMALAYGAAESASDGYARRYTFVIGPDGRIEAAIDTKDPGGQAAELLAKF